MSAPEIHWHEDDAYPGFLGRRAMLFKARSAGLEVGEEGLIRVVVHVVEMVHGLFEFCGGKLKIRESARLVEQRKASARGVGLSGLPPAVQVPSYTLRGPFVRSPFASRRSETRPRIAFTEVSFVT